jgi:hypothetical protein
MEILREWSLRQQGRWSMWTSSIYTVDCECLHLAIDDLFNTRSSGPTARLNHCLDGVEPPCPKPAHLALPWAHHKANGPAQRQTLMLQGQLQDGDGPPIHTTPVAALQLGIQEGEHPIPTPQAKDEHQRGMRPRRHQILMLAMVAVRQRGTREGELQTHTQEGRHQEQGPGRALGSQPHGCVGYFL